ncbi:MAG: Maf family protein [Gammaproteobacteria bacterium]|nr:Maf family protein [Gammaproteobacteria bacterium]
MSEAVAKENFIYLASRSPRRCELLEQLGISFEQVPADIDETINVGEDVEAYVLRMAIEKAQVAAAKLDQSNVTVLGADTSVVIDGQVLGKPKNQADAAAMLRQLSNSTHCVMSSVAIVGGGKEFVELSKTNVKFRQITDAEIRAYWRTKEPLDKAGGYAIQGCGAMFVESIHGSYSGVMGLPLFETSRLLKNFGYSLLVRVIH